MTLKEALSRAAPSDVRGGELELALEGWMRALAPENKSPRTLNGYRIAIEVMIRFLQSKGMPLRLTSITREHMQEFINDQLRRGTPATASLRYRCAALFFKWLVEEGEIQTSPMLKTKPPRVPETLAPVLAESQIKALIAVCEADKSFEGLRDAAIVRTFLDSGLRLSELTGIMLWRPDEDGSDVDLNAHRIFVIGKGNKPRYVSLQNKAVRALDRYIRARNRHRLADTDGNLWLGRKGPMTPPAVAHMVMRRGKQAGISGMHPHLLRHTFAHIFRAAGGSEGDLMQLAGWKSLTMVRRYGSSVAAERAHASHQRLKIGDAF